LDVKIPKLKESEAFQWKDALTGKISAVTESTTIAAGSTLKTFL
jgi:hypothetical protein